MYSEEGNLLSIDAWEKRYGAPSPLGVTRVEEYQAYPKNVPPLACRACACLLQCEA